MKLADHNYGFEGQLPEKRIHFKIQTSAKLFDILSSGLYEDKQLAPIRELSCNAYDAHKAAGKSHVPFRINAPTYLEPTFSITDEGTGIDPEKIGEIFWTYGASTKTDSDEFIGALGLGSKSPFAYTKSSFTVKNRYQGIEHIYLCFINETGEPDGSPLGSAPATEPDGITVEFAVRQEDVYPFRSRIERFFTHWEGPLPIINDEDIEIVKEERVAQGKTWYLSKSTFRSAIAVMGNVPYPINFASIPNMPKSFALITNNPFVIRFPMGALNFAASREALQYDERTCKALLKAFEEVRAELSSTFQAEIFNCPTHLSFLTTFKEKFADLRESIRVDLNAISSTTVDDALSEIFLSRPITDSIYFKGVDFKIQDLVNGKYNQSFEGHLPFGLYQYAVKGSGSRIAHLTSVCYNVAKPFPVLDLKKTVNQTSVLFELEESKTSSYEIGTPFSLGRWKPSRVKNPKTVNVMDRIMDKAKKSPEFFTISTDVQLQITNAMGSGVTLVINDLGGVGQDRFKAIARKNGYEKYVLAMNPDPKDVTLAELQAAVAEFAESFTGATVTLISKLPDCRTANEVAQKEKGIFKAPSTTYALKHGKLVHVRGFDRAVDPGKKTVFKLQELIDRPYVFYTIRTRNKGVFEPTVTGLASSNRALITKFHDLEFLSKEKVFDDFVDDVTNELTVINILESQVKSLKSKGVKLTSLEAMVSEKMKEIEAAEGLYAKFREKSEIFNSDDYQRARRSYERFISFTKDLSPDSLFLKTVQHVVKMADGENAYLKLQERATAFFRYVPPPPEKKLKKPVIDLAALEAYYPVLCLYLSNMHYDPKLLKKFVEFIKAEDEKHGIFATNDCIGEVVYSNILV